MATVPAEIHGPSDAELIEAVRSGQVDAFGSLYQRHVSSAYNLARQLARSRAESDDLVSEAFARVLDTLRAGRGPDSAFRAYLLTALRHVAYDKTRRDRKVELTDDVTAVSGISVEKISEPFKDTAVAGLERTLAAKAFARLPERWQAVLWHTEIEGQSPAEVAPLLGLTANGVSALAYRAREGLRQAYLQVHLDESTAARCQATTEKLGAWTRGGLSKRETAQVEAHLDECERCQALAAELADVNGGLRVIATLVLGIGAAGYLATTAKASAGVALVAAGTSGGAAGAAGAASSLPRQFVGVGASVAALAAALALALATGTVQHIPAAAAPPPAVQPAPPPKPKPVVPPPPVVIPPPAPTPTPRAPAPTPSPTPGVTPTPAPPPPPPGHAVLNAAGPAESIVLTPGQGAVDLPLTIRNTGDAASDPVTAVLHLPPGVSALGNTAQGALGAHSLDSQRIGRPPRTPAPTATTNAPSPPPGSISCPAGTGTVTCTTPTGLPPGGSVVMVFRLAAALGTQPGQITGTVSAGSAVAVTISVRVQVPALVDQLALRADVDEFDSWWNWLWDGSPVLDIKATNVGTSTKPVTVVVDRAGALWQGEPGFTCTGLHEQVTCTTDAPLAPKQSAHLKLRLTHMRPVSDVVNVTGTLGLDTESVQVEVRRPDCPLYWCQPGPPTEVTAPVPDTGQPPTDTRTIPPTTTTPPTRDHGPTPAPTGGPTEPNGPTTTTTAPPTAPPTTTTTKPPPPARPPVDTPPDPVTTTPPTPGCPSGPPGPGKVAPGVLCGLVPGVLGLLGPI
ncbi:MAG TPA: sigma-70 family RNA polymerase sigma factor [Pseudonocardiaceae bacterium]|nr:sigma-70 family RNA polymerase sigma factor [Pseudonocardiaceae bacterium]